MEQVSSQSGIIIVVSPWGFGEDYMTGYSGLARGNGHLPALKEAGPGCAVTRGGSTNHHQATSCPTCPCGRERPDFRSVLS